MKVSVHDDHVQISPDPEQRQAFPQIIAAARTQTIYSAAPDVALMRAGAVGFARSALARAPSASLEWHDLKVAGLPGIECRWPGDVEPARVLYFHGGGFVCGSLEAARGVIGGICAALQSSVISVGYRQGPEHPHPAAIEDAHASFASVTASVSRPVLLIGESAGGLLAIEAGRRAVEFGMQKPRGIIALSPWFDLSMSGRSWIRNSSRDIISKEMGTLFQSCYLAGQDPCGIWAAQLAADFSGLPPVLMQVGEYELPLEDSRALASRIRQIGGRVTLEVYDAMPHGFVKFAGPVGDFALRRMATWVAELEPL